MDMKGGGVSGTGEVYFYILPICSTRQGPLYQEVSFASVALSLRFSPVSPLHGIYTTSAS